MLYLVCKYTCAMPYYHRLGQVPAKRHTQFRQPNNSLYQEELVSTRGFSGISSLLYHIHPPTCVEAIEQSTPIAGEAYLSARPLQHTHLKTTDFGLTGKDFLSARCTLFKNEDVAMGICHPSERQTDFYYKNADADEVLFIHEGEGMLHSQFGTIEIRAGDYVVIPCATIYKLQFTQGTSPRLLIIESYSAVKIVPRYRNELGQLLEHAPYCERDIRPPTKLLVEEETTGLYRVKIKKGGYIHSYLYKHSPFDVVGWDGFLFPYAFSIHDFEPITGRIHQPPPVHQTFQAHNFVICSFVPRLFDYHPLAIPVPYNHSNIDSDEVLYYVDGNFMSRRGIGCGSFTLHPSGLPHGPHPGTVEASLGAKETKELAVMLDTFRPLRLTEAAKPFIDHDYPMSWQVEPGKTK